MSIHVLVKAHPAREDLHRPLVESLGVPTTVVYDPDPFARRRSCWRTFAACLDQCNRRVTSCRGA